MKGVVHLINYFGGTEPIAKKIIFLHAHSLGFSDDQLKQTSCALCVISAVHASVSHYAFCSSLHHELICQALLWTDTLHPHIALGHRVTLVIVVKESKGIHPSSLQFF